MNNSTKDVFRLSCVVLGAELSFSVAQPSGQPLINRTVVLVFNSMLIIPTVLLNAVAIITIFKSSQLKNKPCYFIILVQSTMDLAVGLLGIPSFLVYVLSKMGEYKSCFASLTHQTTILLIDVSTIILFVMTLERYVAIMHPFRYTILITRKRIIVCVCVGSLVFLTVLFLSRIFLTRPLIDVWIIIQSTLFFLVTLFAYTRIFLVVRKLARLQRKLLGSADEYLTKTKLFHRNIKHAKSCFKVMASYVALHYLPVLLMVSLKHTNTLKELYIDVHIWVVTLELLNSSVNSMIFFWTKTILRTEATKILKTLRF